MGPFLEEVARGSFAAATANFEGPSALCCWWRPGWSTTTGVRVQMPLLSRSHPKGDDRTRRRSVRRVEAAGFPHDNGWRDFDFDANPDIDRPPSTPSQAAAGSAPVSRCA